MNVPPEMTATNEESTDRQYTTNLSDMSLLTFERMHTELLSELTLKRTSLERCRHELQQASLKQHELERALDSERRTSVKSHIERQVAIDAIEKMEEERRLNLPQITVKNMQAEIAEKENSVLKEDYRALQLENLSLKSKIESLEGKLRCDIGFKKDSTEQLTQIRQSIVHIERMIQQLESDHRLIKNEVKEQIKMNSQVEHGVKIHMSKHQKLCTDYKHLEQLVIDLAACECVSNTEEAKNSNSTSSLLNDISTVTEIRKQLDSEQMLNATLTTGLETAIFAQRNLIQTEMQLKKQLATLQRKIITKPTQEKGVQVKDECIK